jgi:hypothetical protein
MARPRKVKAGRLVTYVGANDDVERPAIISRVYSDGSVSLTVFDPVNASGSYSVRKVPESDWHWPELT